MNKPTKVIKVYKREGTRWRIETDVGTLTPLQLSRLLGVDKKVIARRISYNTRKDKSDFNNLLNPVREAAPKGRSTLEYIGVFGAEPIRPLVAKADELLEGERVLIYPSPSDRTRFRFKLEAI